MDEHQIWHQITLLKATVDRHTETLAKMHVDPSQVMAAARDHADRGDDKLRGELVQRLAQLERTATDIMQHIHDLQQLLQPFAPSQPADKTAWIKDWRVIAAGGVLVGILASHSPLAIAALAKYMMGGN